ncbi:MAG TPA: ABC transporter ATP-binding protein [Anaerolineales bacterium]|nr:ABC transporter ATP-binding protein [Anaerolineales bacterium]
MAKRSESDGPIIWGKDITKEIGEHLIIKNLNLEIPRGLIFGFIGPSGCGKTTTIRLLTGVYRPTTGDMRVIGKQPVDFTVHDREKIGYMPQNFTLYPDLTVWENMSFAASIYGLGLGRRSRIRQLLEFTELYEDRRKLASQISGGMQRRLSLAATLIHRPELLFLDEPTGGIDPVLRRKFWDYFEELRHEGETLFVTTQYISEAAYCDMVGIMIQGNLLAVDTPEGLRRRAMGGEVVVLKTQDYLAPTHITMIDQLPFVKGKTVRSGENEVRIIVDEAGTVMQELVEWCAEHHIDIDSIQAYLAPFDDVFVALIEKLSKDT